MSKAARSVLCLGTGLLAVGLLSGCRRTYYGYTYLVNVTVTDENGNPIKGASVTETSDNSFRGVHCARQTDARGEATVSDTEVLGFRDGNLCGDCPPIRKVSVRVTKAGYEPKTVVLNAEEFPWPEDESGKKAKALSIRLRRKE